MRWTNTMVLDNSITTVLWLFLLFIYYLPQHLCSVSWSNNVDRILSGLHTSPSENAVRLDTPSLDSCNVCHIDIQLISHWDPIDIQFISNWYPIDIKDPSEVVIKLIAHFEFLELEMNPGVSTFLAALRGTTALRLLCFPRGYGHGKIRSNNYKKVTFIMERWL